MSEHKNKAEDLGQIREHLLYLKELGVELVTAPDDLTAARPAVDLPGTKNDLTQVNADLIATTVKIPLPDAASTIDKRGSAISRLRSLPRLSKRTDATAAGTVAAPDEMIKKTGLTGDRATIEAIEAIRNEIGQECSRCRLCSLGRSQVVNSVGNTNARLMFVGEAPGADEDRFGEPFVGRAGQLLTDIIEKGLEIPREQVFIGNINRCRPPGNRAPEPDETAACKPFLLREIETVKPKVIVVLGATAAHNLLDVRTPISKMRGQFHDYMGVKVMPTFHPAYLLRDPNKKREVWEDIKMVRALLNALAE